MGNNFSKYDNEFKKSLVSMYQNGKTQTQLTREYGVSISMGRVYSLMKSIQLPKMSTHRNIF